MSFLLNWLYSPDYKKYENIILHENYYRNKRTTFIAGSYVYKHLVRGEKVNDIDVIYDGNVDSKGKLIQKMIPTCKFGLKGLAYQEITDYSCLWCDINNSERKLKIDIIPKDDFLEQTKRGISFVNALVLTENGIEDIHQNDKRREFVIKNLKKKRYCKTHNLRIKDKAYFSDFQIIDPEECAKYGFYGEVYDLTKN